MKSLFCIAALLLPLTAAADENFRCGKWIASSSMSIPELLEKCGEPTARSTETKDVTARNANNGLLVKVGETTIDTWVYDRTPNADMVVTIVDGRIKSIDRGG